jgi:Essential protein Yae1, N terminal
MLLESLSTPEQEPTLHTHSTVDPWLDDFESDPPLTGAGISARPDEAFQEHSDVPRLQAIHSNAGYRDGIAEAKGKYIQAGFDEGYGLGGEIGRACGTILGILNGIVAGSSPRSGRKRGHVTIVSGISSNDSQQNPELERIHNSARSALAQAKKELAVESVLGPEYLTKDGVWMWEVEDEQALFADVATKHPLLVRWRTQVDAIMTEYLELDIPSKQ